MTKPKGAPKPRKEFPVKGIKVSKTRLLTGSALVEAVAKASEARRKQAEPTKR